MRPSIGHGLAIAVLALSTPMSIGVLATSVHAQSRLSSSQSNLVATNVFQSQATLNAERQLNDDTIRRLRAEAETARANLRRANGRSSQRIEALEQAAADAQLAFTAELANRDAEYARERQQLINSATTFLQTEAGRRFLMLKNEGSAEAWEQAKTIFEEGLLARRFVLAAEYRAGAVQYLDQRNAGLETTENVIAIYEEVVRLDGTTHSDWVRLRRLYFDAGRLNDAERAAQQALQTAGDERARSVAYNEIGDVQRAQGDLLGARASYERSLAIAETLAAADPSSASLQRDLSVSYNNIGDVQAAQGDLPGALVSYEQFLAIAETLAAADPSSAALQRDLSLSNNKIGDVQVAQGDLPGALASFERSLAIRETLAAADPSSASLQHDLSVSHQKIGDVQVAQGDLPGALVSYERSLLIFETLAASDPSSASLQRSVWVSLWKLAEINNALGFPWSRVVEQLEEMEQAGTLFPNDQRWLVEARRRARLEQSDGSAPPSNSEARHEKD